MEEQEDGSGNTHASAQEDLAARAELLLRKGIALEGLNKRIARLAIALDLRLDTDQGLQQALEAGPSSTVHTHTFQEELRGLLTLRFQMERQLADEVGVPTLHRMVTEVEKHMQTLGFAPGVDGMHEEHLFDPRI